MLRIQAGSQEAGFLAAFCPVDNVPSLVLIENGQLKERIVVGVEKDEFVRRLRGAFGVAESAPVSQDAPSTAPADSQPVTEAEPSSAPAAAESAQETPAAPQDQDQSQPPSYS
ncbi:MAG: hypothetical protein INR71_14265, partial [Terriglobus roseus]|nr:hypothetical protein [Terriglobus roseus]